MHIEETKGWQTNHLNQVILSAVSGNTFDAQFPTRFVGEEYFLRLGPLSAGDFTGVSISFTYLNGAENTSYKDSSGNDIVITEPGYITFIAGSELSTLSVSGLSGGLNFAWKLRRK